MGLLSLIIAVAIVTVVYKLYKSLWSKLPAPNPFEDDSRLPTKPKETDQKKRDEVLKQSFNGDKVPQDLDALVIGSGIGGLTTAALMAKAAKKVLVLEQHDQAGGCCHTFIDKGYEFDVGIHYIGEMTYQSVTKTMMDQISQGQIEWEHLNEEFDEVVFAEEGKPLRRYPVSHGKGKWQKALHKQFPDEVENIDKFFKYLEEVRASTVPTVLVKVFPLWLVKILDVTGLIRLLSSYWTWNAKTVKQLLEEVTTNQELRDILCYNFGDYGTLPSRAGFPMQALLHSHFMRGASYPIGGASEIAYNIIPVIEASGGRVLVRAEVKEILFDENGQVYAVNVQKGNTVTRVKTPCVISDAGLYNTFEKLLPRKIASSSRLWPIVQEAEHAVGAMSVFVGLDCPIEDLDIAVKKNLWVFSGNDIDKISADYIKYTVDEALDAPVPLMFVSFPSTKDPNWNDRFPGKTTLAIVTLMPYHWFEKWENERCMKRGDEYEALKKTLGQKLVDQTCDIFPSIQSHIDYVNIGSPLSNKYYIAAPKGEIYGLDHTDKRFSAWWTALLRPETDIPGLYLTGQDILSCGFSGALWGGFMCAGSVLNRNLYNDLVELHKSNKVKDKGE